MTQPVAYYPDYNFTQFQASNPATPLPAASLDGELFNIAAFAAEVCTNLALIQRDDGALANQSVGIDQLKGEVTFGINAPTDWVTAHAYVARDSVYEGNAVYICLVAHTSTVFATDLAAGFWQALVDFSSYINAAAASATAAAASATAGAASAVLASQWASLTSGIVAATAYSAKEYAQGSQASTGGSAKNWAQQTGADVTGAAALSRAAKSWAQDVLVGATYGGSAKDWAQSASLPDGTNKSAKSYASDAATSAAAAAASAAGYSIKTACRASSTGNLTATYANGVSGVGATLTATSNVAFPTQDGVTLALNDRYLYKDATTTFQNGIFALTVAGSGATPWILTRVTDYDQSSEIFEGTAVLIEEGTVNAARLYVMTAPGTITVGTSAITFLAPTSVPANNSVTNAILAQMPANTVKMNNTGSPANAIDATMAQFNAVLQSVVTVKRQIFTSPGTYTPSAGMLYCMIETIGGGGGGGGMQGTTGISGGGAGGGSGGYSRLLASAATIGASKAVAIGAAGAGATAGFNSGSAGGDTSVGTLCIGKGGGGGAGSNNGTVGSSGAGGVAGTGDVALPGNPGVAGVFYGGNLAIPAGNGGNGYFGGAGVGAANTFGGAAPANSGGGGAGGATQNSGSATAGGAGGSGFAAFTEYCSQ